MEWLSAEGVTHSCIPAARKLRRSATTTNPARLPRSPLDIAEFPSTGHVSIIGFLFSSSATDYGSGPSKYREVQPRPRRNFVSELSGAKASWAKVSHVP